MEKIYDRTTQDVGNILGMEHVNVTIPNQEMAMMFYVSGLGFTRDPYMMVGRDNMWVNVGQQQFHLPTREPQVLRGTIGVVVPDLETLKMRLVALREPLAGTQFTCAEENGHVNATCPWGNQFRCHAPGPQFGDMTLGVPYVEFTVAPGTAAGIGQFYKEVMCAPYTLTEDMNGAIARVRVGNNQYLIFRETPGALPEYDGHHIAVYVANFSRPHKFLKDRGLITQESDDHQYRFQDIVHPETGRVLFTIEHEVRSLYHPMYGREFVNRNPAQNIRGYARGRDSFAAVGV
jgi:hypothetical protein